MPRPNAGPPGIRVEEQERSMKPISKMISPLALVTVAAAFALATPLIDRHPDGPATAYRGWGPTSISQDGYTCTLYAPTGNRVGSFFSGFTNGKVDLNLYGKEAHFSIDPGGFLDLQDLDEGTFPNLADV